MSVVLTFCALKWLHTFLLMNNPLKNELCWNFMESAKRSKCKPITKKKPLSVDMIKEIIDRYAGPDCNLKELRIAAICSLGFAGFLRFDEVSNMSVKHLEFHENYMSIFIPPSKTDVYREGNIVYINPINNKYCPVDLTMRFVSIAGTDLKSDLPLFHRVIFHKEANSYSLGKSGLSYTRCLEMLKNCLEELSYNTKEFGLPYLFELAPSALIKFFAFFGGR